MSMIRDEIRHSIPGARHHLFFIPGNPGLVSYYTAFLASLSKQLNPPNTAHPVSIYGKSLSRFEVAPNELLSLKYNGSLIDLDGQVANVEKSLRAYCADLTSNQRPKVLLMGHSVGTYILLEVLRRHKEAKRLGQVPFDIVSGILLFPTVVDLALSPRGRKIAAIATLQYTYAAVGAFAYVITRLLPAAVLSWAVKMVTGMPPDGAAVTEAFLRSELGVREALYLARFELLQITKDKWDADVWQSASTPDPTNLHLYFGQDDPWVANRTRDELIRTRGHGKGISVEVDQLKVPHDFCIRHSELVAGLVHQHISDLFSSNVI